MIRVHNLSKFYGGKRALGPVSFEIRDGETVGFLGLNGAGKTTALRILACDLRPSAGTVAIDDADVVKNPQAVRRRIGFLPENPPLYQDMTVTGYLEYAGRLRAMSRTAVSKRLPQVLELTDLDDVADELIAHLSHGYRQRVGVAQAVIHEPKLLVLDEPTRGLDPVQIVEMRKMLRNLKEAHTVLISSHILTEISQTCDRILVLGNGEILASGDEAQLAENLVEVSRVTVVVSAPASDVAALCEPLRALKGVTSVSDPVASGEGSELQITCTNDVRAALARVIVAGGYDLLRLDRARSELEGTFLQLVAGGNRARN